MDIINSELDLIDASDMKVRGYALKFNKRTVLYEDENIKVMEVIDPNALTGADKSDVILSRNHDDNFILARTKNGSLGLLVDDVGLKIDAQFIDTQIARDTFEEIRSKLISKMSFKWAGGLYKDTIESEGSKDVMVRTWTNLGTLIDVSAVTFPAYDDTQIEEVRARFKKNTEQSEADNATKEAYLKKIFGGNE